jgi:hypothetical protein
MAEQRANPYWDLENATLWDTFFRQHHVLKLSRLDSSGALPSTIFRYESIAPATGFLYLTKTYRPTITSIGSAHRGAVASKSNVSEKWIVKEI